MPWENGTVWVPYDTSAAGNATGFIDLIQYNNSITGDATGLSILVAICLIIFIAGGRRDPEVSLAAGLFTTTILSYLAASMDIIGDWVAWAFTFALVISVIVLYMGGKSNV